MKYTIDKHERYVVIEPLRKEIDGKAAHLNQVTDINEDGVRMGLLAHRLCSALGGVFIIINMNSTVYNVLKVLHLDKHFTILKSLTDAEDMIFGIELQRDLIKGK